MSENPFGEAMDEAEEQQEQQSTTAEAGPDVNDFLATINDGEKTETIGIRVSEEAYYLYQELQRDDTIDVDPLEDMRSHLENLGNRHPKAAKRAAKKLEIDRDV